MFVHNSIMKFFTHKSKININDIDLLWFFIVNIIVDILLMTEDDDDFLGYRSIINEEMLVNVLMMGGDSLQILINQISFMLNC